MRRAFVLALLVVGIGVPAQAASCELTARNGEFRVARISPPDGSAHLRFSYTQTHPLQVPFVDEAGHASVMGIYTSDGDRHLVRLRGSAPPRAKVEEQGRVLVDMPVPSTIAAGLHSWADFTPSGFVGRPEYVVAFGWGHPSGSWLVSVYAEGVPCTAVDIPGELSHFDHTDFSGGRQVYYPPGGLGSGLRYRHVSTRTDSFGVAYAAASATGSGAAFVDLRIPALGKRVGTYANFTPIDHFFATGPGPLDFELDYRGVDALASVTILDLDLPSQ